MNQPVHFYKNTPGKNADSCWTCRRSHIEGKKLSCQEGYSDIKTCNGRYDDSRKPRFMTPEGNGR